eukprot:scaffold30298_cov91-Isochrysis_galbana.AAC.1
MFATVHAAGSSLLGLFGSCTTFDSTWMNQAAARNMQRRSVSSAESRSRPGQFFFMGLAALGPPGTWRDRQVTPTYSARSPDLAPDLAEHPRFRGRWISTRGPSHTPFGGVRHPYPGRTLEQILKTYITKAIGGSPLGPRGMLVNPTYYRHS